MENDGGGAARTEHTPILNVVHQHDRFFPARWADHSYADGLVVGYANDLTGEIDPRLIIPV